MVIPRKFLLSALTLLPIAAAAWFVCAHSTAWTPGLEAAILLGREGRHAEAEAIIERYLKSHPADTRALLLRARLSLERPEPRPEIALQSLALIKSFAPKLMARVELDRGRAYEMQKALAKAEESWLKAIAYDPTVPEAGWSLLGLYYLQGRADESRRLALRLHETEPDAHDQVQFLLELLRQEVQPPDPASLIPILEPVVRLHPNDVRSSAALGLAQIRNSQWDQGLESLRSLAASHPEDEATWAGLLEGLELANRGDELAQSFERIPLSLSSNPSFGRFRGRVAQDRGDWKAAARFYQHAFASKPEDDQILYRLARALKVAGDLEAAGRFDALARTRATAKQRALDLYASADASLRARRLISNDLLRRIAEQRERSGHVNEALAWYRLAIRQDSRDETARSAILRLDESGSPHELAASRLRAHETVKEAVVPSEVRPGFWFERRGDLEGAERSWRKALERNSDDLEALIGMGRLQSSQRKWVDAIAYFQRALEIDSVSLPAAYGLSRAYLAMGDSTKALYYARLADQIRLARPPVGGMGEPSTTMHGEAEGLGTALPAPARSYTSEPAP